MSSPPQDFITDPVNPNVGGLLENIKRSCRAVINENGNNIYSLPLSEVVFTCLGSAVLVKSVCPPVFFNTFSIFCSTEMESDAEVTFHSESHILNRHCGQPYLQHNLRRVSSATTSMRFNNSSSLLPTTKAMGHGGDDILSWTDQDPRESQLFNSWGVMYSFQVRQSMNFAFSEYYANIFF